MFTEPGPLAWKMPWTSAAIAQQCTPVYLPSRSTSARAQAIFSGDIRSFSANG
jgi:hypothetical protein